MENCEKCNANYGHNPFCEDIDLETAKVLLKEYYEAWLKIKDKEIVASNKLQSHLQKKINKLQEEKELYKGKYFILKEENNKLRKENKLLKK